MSATSEYPSLHLHLRPATLSDLSQITSLVLPQVSHDGFHDYFFPHQDRYPGDFVFWWKRYFRDIILRPYTVVLLAEDLEQKIHGIAVWMYAPKATGGNADDVPEPRGLDIAKDSWFEVIRRRIYGWVDVITDIIHPNRSIDPISLQEWNKTVIDMGKRLWSGNGRVHWFSAEFFTSKDPELDKRAMASLLLGWGIQQSKVDVVSTFVLTLVSLRDLYEGVGFQLVDEVECHKVQLSMMAVGDAIWCVNNERERERDESSQKTPCKESEPGKDNTEPELWGKMEVKTTFSPTIQLTDFVYWMFDSRMYNIHASVH
ncbi:hypothetical protein BT96DRAFT_981904 [Gymnopus androsaceus JB14]|uniref:N-acetyltransferase domain-containing protein n=1 Tax=Gymnopus androsaceus JB14 TaxID=1447944 RepID=A0A6A4GK97_9AGAR|nr:hypothetical protein BT96DRAFT_981904 [Gymnopus androsaceus JB14]